MPSNGDNHEAAILTFFVSRVPVFAVSSWNTILRCERVVLLGMPHGHPIDMGYVHRFLEIRVGQHFFREAVREGFFPFWWRIKGVSMATYTVAEMFGFRLLGLIRASVTGLGTFSSLEGPKSWVAERFPQKLSQSS
jgi:hypothetical protein